jgi:hypothetical protein
MKIKIEKFEGSSYIVKELQEGVVLIDWRCSCISQNDYTMNNPKWKMFDFLINIIHATIIPPIFF